jgi:integrase
MAFHTSRAVDTVHRLTEQEQKRLLCLASGLDRIALLLLFDTGLEVEDLIEARISDVDLQEGTILIRPSGKKVKISPDILEELNSYIISRPGQVYLLEGRCGKAITSKWKRCFLETRIRCLASKSEELG